MDDVTALMDVGPASEVRAPLSAPYAESPLPNNQRQNSKLPRLHWCAYKGDIQGVLLCITDNCSLHETVSLRNQHGRLVCGITALFLAAQRGHSEIVKLLVTNGASPVQPCYIQGSTELCTPAEVASLNLHFKLARWLKNAARARRKEDEVLALDDGDRMSQISGRLARGMQRARSVRSAGAPAPGSMSGALMRMSRGSRAGAMSVDGAGGAPGGGTLSELGFGREGGEVDTQRLAALNFMHHVDLAAFDPDAGDVPPVVVPGGGFKGSSSEGPMKRLFRRIITWGGKDGGVGVGGFGGSGGVRASASHRVQRGGGSSSSSAAPAAAAQLRTPGLDVEAVDPTRPDHTKVLQRFLKDLDLAHWRPENDGPPERSTQGGSSTRPASPGRAGRGGSPPRSARSNASPARSRA